MVGLMQLTILEMYTDKNSKISYISIHLSMLITE